MKRPMPPGFRSRLPRVSPSALDTPERVIEFCRHNNLMTDYDAVDIEEVIARDDALTVKYEDLGEKDAYIKCISDDEFIIGIHKHHPRNRQRFSMAHEYGHYQLHRNNIKKMEEGERILHRDGEISSTERQANKFAAQLLMPEWSVHRALKDANGNVTEAAKLLEVSVAALDYRMLDLGLLNGG